jgi:hypothetical protein
MLGMRLLICIGKEGAETDGKLGREVSFASNEALRTSDKFYSHFETTFKVGQALAGLQT